MSGNQFRLAAQAIASAGAIAVLTGAGVSKESGVPTFRDALEGLWSQYDPEELATPQAFQKNPKLVWDWYQMRREMVKQVKPNPGHFALAQLQTYKASVQIITQNVDDLHERAGSKDVIHLHGNIARNKCFYNCQGVPTIVDIAEIEYDTEAGPPLCPHCGRWIRPDVVWFGETLPEYELQQAITTSQHCDLMIVIGTSGLVSPASTLPSLAKQVKAQIIEVNPDYSMITRLADIKLQGPSGQILPALIEELHAIS